MIYITNEPYTIAMIEVCLFALGVGIGFGLSTLSFRLGSKVVDNAVSKFTAPIQVEEEPTLSSEVNPVYDFQQYEDTLKQYIGTDIQEPKENTEPKDEDFSELN